MMDGFTVISLGGKKFACRREGQCSASWLNIIAYDWLDGYGWDTIAPIRRRETLKALDKALELTLERNSEKTCQSVVKSIDAKQTEAIIHPSQQPTTQTDGSKQMTYLDAFKLAENILERLMDGFVVLTSEVHKLEYVVECYREPRHQGLRDRFELILAKMDM